MTTSTRSRMPIPTFIGVLILSFALALGGCDSDSSGDDGGGDVGGGDETLFRATLKDFQTKVPVEGGECYLLYNIYEDEAQGGAVVVPASEMPAGYTNPIVSGTDGQIEVKLPAGRDYWGWKCDSGDSYRTTYQFNIASDIHEFDGEEIWVISNGMYDLAPQLAGIDLDTSLGVVAGRLVFVDDQDRERFVGCAHLEFDPSEGVDVRYFGGNDLPVDLPENDDVAGRTTTNPANALFIAANMPVGAVDMTAKLEAGTVVGGETIFSEGGSVVISNIHVGRLRGAATDDTFTANPQPDGCQ